MYQTNTQRFQSSNIYSSAHHTYKPSLVSSSCISNSPSTLTSLVRQPMLNSTFSATPHQLNQSSNGIIKQGGSLY